MRIIDVRDVMRLRIKDGIAAFVPGEEGEEGRMNWRTVPGEGIDRSDDFFPRWMDDSVWSSNERRCG